MASEWCVRAVSLHHAARRHLDWRPKRHSVDLAVSLDRGINVGHEDSDVIKTIRSSAHLAPFADETIPVDHSTGREDFDTPSRFSDRRIENLGWPIRCSSPLACQYYLPSLLF